MIKSIAITHTTYGNFDQERLEITLESIKHQDFSPIEVIVFEQNSQPFFEKEARRKNVNYKFLPVENNVTNLGKIRNEALAMVTSDAVYTNDSDIIFTNTHYISELINILNSRNVVLHKPPLRRLPISCFDEFCNRFNEHGLLKTLETLDLKVPYIARTNHSIGANVIIKNNRKFTITTDEVEKTKKDRTGDAELLYARPVLHAGATMARMDAVIKVGGYSESYLTYGWEDSDLQWKLGETNELKKIPDEERFTVLHLDHKKEYFNKERFYDNKDIFEQRIRDGIKLSVESDLRKGKSLFVRRIRNARA